MLFRSLVAISHTSDMDAVRGRGIPLQYDDVQHRMDVDIHHCDRRPHSSIHNDAQNPCIRGMSASVGVVYVGLVSGNVAQPILCVTDDDNNDSR